MEEFFIALVPITLVLSVAGVLIFRPLTKRLGNVLEANALAKRQTEENRFQEEHLKTLIETQNLRILQLEQRIEFTESLLETRHQTFAGPRPRRELT